VEVVVVCLMMMLLLLLSLLLLLVLCRCLMNSHHLIFAIVFYLITWKLGHAFLIAVRIPIADDVSTHAEKDVESILLCINW
jgi:hypothetical protein